MKEKIIKSMRMNRVQLNKTQEHLRTFGFTTFTSFERVGNIHPLQSRLILDCSGCSYVFSLYLFTNY